MDGILVNSDPEIDPLFGTVHPVDPEVLWVTVTPGKQTSTLLDWFFIFIIPMMDPDQRLDAISSTMKKALADGDLYSVKTVAEKMAETFDLSTPILSYDQKHLNNFNELRMVWLRPPRKMMT